LLADLELEYKKNQIYLFINFKIKAVAAWLILVINVLAVDVIINTMVKFRNSLQADISLTGFEHLCRFRCLKMDFLNNGSILVMWFYHY